MWVSRVRFDILGRIKSDRHAIPAIVKPILIAQPRCEILLGNAVLLLLVLRCPFDVIINVGHWNSLVAGLAPKAILSEFPTKSVKLAPAETTWNFRNWRNRRNFRNLKNFRDIRSVFALLI